MTGMTRYAGVYELDRQRLSAARSVATLTAAAARLAHYRARQVARQYGRTPGAVLSIQTAESARVDGIALFDEDVVAVRVEIETSNGAT